MKKIRYLLLGILIMMSALAHSQAPGPRHELGLYTNTRDAYGLIYKFGPERFRYRLSLLNLTAVRVDFDSNNPDLDRQHSFGLGGSFGFEVPVAVNEAFQFYYGPELGVNYHRTKESYPNGDDVRSTYQNYSLRLVLGASVRLAERVKLSAEMLPQFSYSKNKVPDDVLRNYSLFSFALQNSNCFLTLSYLF